MRDFYHMTAVAARAKAYAAIRQGDIEHGQELHVFANRMIELALQAKD